MNDAMVLAEEPISYSIEPIAARGFLTVLAGRHSSFKTWLMIATGHAAHRGGGEVGGLRCEDTTVLYVDAENGPRLMARRFKTAGIPTDGLVVADGGKLRLPDKLGPWHGVIEHTGAGLVVLDSLRRLAPGIRENEATTCALIADIGTIARELDVAIVLIHHRSSKRGAATVRGSSSIEDQSDLVFTLGRVEGDQDRERRQLKCVKFRIDAEPPSIWLRMGMIDGRFTVADARPDRAEGPGRPRERDNLRDDVLSKLGGIPRSGRNIAKALGLDDDRTVRRVLSDLSAAGLAMSKPDGWVRHNSDPPGGGNSAAPPEGGQEGGW